MTQRSSSPSVTLASGVMIVPPPVTRALPTAKARNSVSRLKSALEKLARRAGSLPASFRTAVIA